MMQKTFFGAAVVLACSVGLGAQSATIKQETQVEVKDGKDVKVTGCVTRAPSGTAITLTDVEGSDDDLARTYILVGKDDDIDNHIGHLVEIRGKATDVGDDGKLEVKTKTEIEREDADDKETETKTEIEGDLTGIPYLGIDSVKMVRSTCK
jgi:hypothetical protein